MIRVEEGKCEAEGSPDVLVAELCSVAYALAKGYKTDAIFRAIEKGLKIAERNYNEEINKEGVTS